MAAAGNELAEGNPLLFPASLPHVLTVAAIGCDLKPPFFSSASAAVDLSAPGVGILTATPPQFDEDGTGRRLRGRHRHELLRADGGRRRGVAARREAAATASTRSPRRCAAPRATSSASGWDSATGYGLLDLLERAQRRPPRRSTRTSPTTTWPWINGRATGRVDTPIWRRGGARKLRALVDKYEDPADVYRIVFPPRARVRVTLKPRFGNPDLAAFTRSATSTARRRAADRPLAPQRASARTR